MHTLLGEKEKILIFHLIKKLNIYKHTSVRAALKSPSSAEIVLNARRAIAFGRRKGGNYFRNAERQQQESPMLAYGAFLFFSARWQQT